MATTHMKSRRSNRPAANQLVHHDDDGSIRFQSYDSIVAVINPDRSVYLDTRTWDFSAITSQYLDAFLHEFLGKGIHEVKATAVFKNLNPDKQSIYKYGFGCGKVV